MVLSRSLPNTYIVYDTTVSEIGTSWLLELLSVNLLDIPSLPYARCPVGAVSMGPVLRMY